MALACGGLAVKKHRTPGGRVVDEDVRRRAAGMGWKVGRVSGGDGGDDRETRWKCSVGW